MPDQYTRADSLREYLTGAASDGGTQPDALASIGGFRSETEAVSFGIMLANPILHAAVLYAGGGNAQGVGLLRTIDANTLVWQSPSDTAPGAPVNFSGVNDVKVVEGGTPGRYLRVRGSPPFGLGECEVTLSYLYGNVFGMSEVSIFDSEHGLSEYRATLLKNEASFAVTGIQRWLGTFGTPQTSDAGTLAGVGPGVVGTTGSFATWPSSGWCQVRNSSGLTVKEVVYYTSRSNNLLQVPEFGRGLLGTVSQSGAITDRVFPVPGLAVAIDPAGVVAGGGSIQLLANRNTAPAGVTWNLGLAAGEGLQIGSLQPGQQVGIWMWRQTPPGTVASPAIHSQLMSGWNSY